MGAGGTESCQVECQLAASVSYKRGLAISSLTSLGKFTYQTTHVSRTHTDGSSVWAEHRPKGTEAGEKLRESLSESHLVERRDWR